MSAVLCRLLLGIGLRHTYQVVSSGWQSYIPLELRQDRYPEPVSESGPKLTMLKMQMGLHSAMAAVACKHSALQAWA